MFNIANNGIITITRGDTFTTSIFINLGTELDPKQCVLGEDDRVFFAVCEPNQRFENAIIKKVLTREDLDKNNNVIIDFKHDDTQYLLPGVYYYQVKCYFPTGPIDPETGERAGDPEVHTIIPKTKFIIIE